MNEEYYIGQIFEGKYPPSAAVWCNKNNAYIEYLGNSTFEIKAVPAPTIDVKKDTVRAVRNSYINDIEWRVSRYRDQKELDIQTSDTEETYTNILLYIQYLRDYPESSETWYEQNPLTFEEWQNN